MHGETGAPDAQGNGCTGCTGKRVHRMHDSAIAASTATTAHRANKDRGTRYEAEGRSDTELVAKLHRLGRPMSGRKVMRVLGVGWPRAKRLVDLAGWADPPPTGERTNGHWQPAETETAERAETKSSDPADSRTNQ
jgi:hypothetical protein